jgi:hypothetical protein
LRFRVSRTSSYSSAALGAGMKAIALIRSCQKQFKIRVRSLMVRTVNFEINYSKEEVLQQSDSLTLQCRLKKIDAIDADFA